MATDELYLVPSEVPFLKLACGDAFRKLTKKEKLYAHHMSRASWMGAKICLEQTSPEARKVFEMFQLAFSEKTYDKVKHDNEEDLAGFYNYVAYFYGNLGNYLSFGDRKFVPRIPADTFEAILKKHANKTQESGKRQAIMALWGDVKDKIYALDPVSKELGKPGEATSTYYFGDVTAADVQFISEFMAKHKMEAWNSRLAKDAEGNLTILFAGIETKNPKVDTFDYEGKKVKVQYGDYGPLLRPVVDHLKKAKQHVANDIQKEMLTCYVDHFTTGELQRHKDSQIAWVKDIGPAVETTIGFIENYRDGYGERSEWEGLVSVVNRDQSQKFDALVSQATTLIPLLPWPKEFEKDTFQRPDFTALDVVSFASSGIPVGINIPNYDDIRQNVGFKNVHLHNVLTSRFGDAKDVPFILPEEQETFKALRGKSFEVQVGLHELLGHGSGKVFSKADVDGKALPNPLKPGETVKKYYEEGQTWSSVFKALASSWEECRAEAVGIYLCLERSVLEIFGYKTTADQDDIIFVNWLSMVHAGVVGLEFYSPEAKKWGQAHMHARFAILNVLVRAGEGLVKLEVDDEKMEASITIDKSKIHTVGKKAIGDFLLKLQVLKSTADVEAGTALYEELTAVTDKWLKLREIVLKNKKPRAVYVQAHTIETSPGKVDCLEFAPTLKGMLLSMQYHFGETKVEDVRRLLRPPNRTGAKPLKAARFGMVSKLNPESKSINLSLKVASALTTENAFSEVTVGDGTGVVTLSVKDASSDVVAELSKMGAKLKVRNAKIIMKKGHMRLVVDKWGKIEAPVEDDGSFDFEALTSNDLSAVEYELVK